MKRIQTTVHLIQLCIYNFRHVLPLAKLDFFESQILGSIRPVIFNSLGARLLSSPCTQMKAFFHTASGSPWTPQVLQVPCRVQKKSGSGGWQGEMRKQAQKLKWLLLSVRSTTKIQLPVSRPSSHSRRDKRWASWLGFKAWFCFLLAGNVCK